MDKMQNEVYSSNLRGYTSADLIFDLYKSLDEENRYNTKIKVKSSFHCNVVLLIEIYGHHYEIVFDLKENQGYMKCLNGEIVWEGKRGGVLIYFNYLSISLKKTLI